MKLEEWPNKGELVIVKVKRVSNFGADVELEEYNNKKGFIHISQVASTWVKNIRSFISEGQVRVGEVSRINPRENLIDVSLRRVSGQQEKRKQSDFKREKRADKLYEKFCKENKLDFMKSYKTTGNDLTDEFGDLLAAFENASIYGDEAFEDLEVEIDKAFIKKFIKFAKGNVKVSKVTSKGDLTLISTESNGIETIQKALDTALKTPSVKMEYVSAPVYRIEAEGIDYAEAEKILEIAANAAITFMKKHKGEASFEKVKA